MLLAGAAWVISNVALALFAWGVAERSLATRPRLERTLAAAAGWIMGSAWMVLAAGSVGYLEPRAVLFGSLTLGALGFPLWRSGWRRASFRWPRPPSVPALFAGWAFASACAFWLLRAIWEPRTVTMDDAVYHAPAVAHWITSRSLDPGDLLDQSTFPMTAELFAAFHVLPFGNDAWVAATAVGYAVVLTLAVLVLGKREGQSLDWPGLVVAAAMLSSPVVLRAGASFAAVDLAVAAFLLSAIAFLAGTDTTGARSPGSWAWAFAAAGFAVGVKSSSAPVVAAIFCVLAWRAPRVFPTLRARATAGLTAALALFPMGFWYWRNLLETGNPVYPARVLGLPGIPGFGESSIVDYLLAYPDLAHLRAASAVLLDWPYLFAVVSLLGWASVSLGLARGRSRNDVMLFMLGLVALVWHPFSPFSSGNTTSMATGDFHPMAARYQVFGFAIGGILLARQLHGIQLRSVRGLGVVCSLALVLALPSLVRGAQSGLAYCSILVGAAVWLGAVPRLRETWLPKAAPALVICGLAAAIAGSGWKVRQTDQFARQDQPRSRIGFTGWVTREADKLPSGSRVSGVGLLNVRYPLLGRRYQHQHVQWGARTPTLDEVLETDADWLFVGSVTGSIDFVEPLEASGRATRMAERPTDDRGRAVFLFQMR